MEGVTTMADIRTGVPGAVGKSKKFNKGMKKIKDSVDQQELISLLEQEGLDFSQEELNGCTVVDVTLPHEDAYLSFIYGNNGDLVDIIASYAELNFGILSFDVDFDGDSGLVHKLATVESEAYVDALRELGFVELKEREPRSDDTLEDVTVFEEATVEDSAPEAGEAFEKACTDFVNEWLDVRESDNPKAALYDAVESVVSTYSLDGEIYNSTDAGREAFDVLVQVAPDGMKVVLEELKRAAEAGDVSAYEGVLTDLMIQAMDYEVPVAAAEVADSASEGNILKLDSGVVIAMPGSVRYENASDVPYVSGHSFGPESSLLVTPEAKAAKVFKTLEEAQAYVDEHASDKQKKYVKFLDFNDDAAVVADSDEFEDGLDSDEPKKEQEEFKKYEEVQARYPDAIVLLEQSSGAYRVYGKPAEIVANALADSVVKYGGLVYFDVWSNKLQSAFVHLFGDGYWVVVGSFEKPMVSVQSYSGEYADLVYDSAAPRRNFVFPADSTMVNDGKGHFPINTLSRGRYALSAVAKYDKLPEWYAGDMDLEEFKSHVRSEVSKAYPSIEISDSAPEFKVGDRVKLDTEEAQKRSKAYYGKEGEVTSVSDFVLGVKFDDGKEVPVPTNFATLVTA